MKISKINDKELYIVSLLLIALIVSLDVILKMDLPFGTIYPGSILVLTMCAFLPKRIALIVGSIAGVIVEVLLQDPFYAIFSFIIHLIVISIVYLLLQKAKDNTPVVILGIFSLSMLIMEILYAFSVMIVQLNSEAFLPSLVRSIPQILIISIISTILYPQAAKLKMYF